MDVSEKCEARCLIKMFPDTKWNFGELKILVGQKNGSILEKSEIQSTRQLEAAKAVHWVWHYQPRFLFTCIRIALLLKRDSTIHVNVPSHKSTTVSMLLTLLQNCLDDGNEDQIRAG